MRNFTEAIATILFLITIGTIGIRIVLRGDDRARWNKGKCPICEHDFKYEYKLADEDFPYVYKCEFCDYETQLHYKK